MKAEEKNYTYLLGPEDRYSPNSELPIVEPPSPELVAELWRSVRSGSAAFKAFIPTTSSWDDSLLLFAIDASGQNFLHMAAKVGDLGTLDLLRGKMFLNRHRETLEHLALREKLPRQRDVDGNRPLHIAARNDNLRFVKGLIHWHTFGYVEDPEILDEGEQGLPPMLSVTGRYPVSREELRYQLPLLDYKNKAGRTAAQEAQYAGASATAHWLRAYKRQFVGEDDSDDQYEDNEDYESNEDNEDIARPHQPAEDPCGAADADIESQDEERFLSNRCTVI